MTSEEVLEENNHEFTSRWEMEEVAAIKIEFWQEGKKQVELMLLHESKLSPL